MKKDSVGMSSLFWSGASGVLKAWLVEKTKDNITVTIDMSLNCKTKSKLKQERIIYSWLDILLGETLYLFCSFMLEFQGQFLMCT